jgi:hypothetical protein
VFAVAADEDNGAVGLGGSVYVSIVSLNETTDTTIAVHNCLFGDTAVNGEYLIEHSCVLCSTLLLVW